MPHMIPFYDRMTCFRVETTHGTELVPCDVANLDNLADYLEGRQIEDDVETVTGIFCRLSAPGYMDCTDWAGPFATLDDAMEFITDQYGVNPETGEELEV